MTYDVLIPWADWLPGHLAACLGSLNSAALADGCGVRIIIGNTGQTMMPDCSLAAGRNVVMVHKPRGGLWNRSAALNLAFAHAQEPLVLVVDADTVLCDRYYVEYLQTALVARDTHAAVWAICMEPDGTPHPNGSGGCLLVRREAWEKIGGYDEGYEGWGMEEHDFIERLRRAGYTIAEPLPAGRVLTLWHPRQTDPASVAAVLRNRERFRQKFGKE